MKKGVFLSLLLAVSLLFGCKAARVDAMDQALAFRAKLQGSGGCSFRSRITADYGSQAYTFTLTCEADGEGKLSFRVEDPETIAGITGTVDGDTGKVTFDGTSLAFGPLADGQLGPVSAPYALARSWRTGYITACGPDGEALRMTVDASFEENPVTVDTWLDGEKKVPICGEICYNGQRILTVSIEDFEFITD